MKYASILLIGILLGSIGVYAFFESRVSSSAQNQYDMLKILMTYSTKELNILDNGGTSDDTCSGLKTVGDVIATIIAQNSIERINRTQAGCIDDVCFVSVSGCKLWQDSECNQKILKFNKSNAKPEILSNFVCLDIP